jgi:hypothetical protein
VMGMCPSCCILFCSSFLVIWSPASVVLDLSSHVVDAACQQTMLVTRSLT